MISDRPELSLPHRAPFLWVHRLMERDANGTQGLCELDVKPEWEIFKGHFPNRPIFPGVIQIEAVAQACLWINMGVLKPDQTPPDVLFVSVEKYRFKKPVVPPMTLKLYGVEKQSRGSLFLWDVEVRSKEDDSLISGGSCWMQKTPR